MNPNKAEACVIIGARPVAPALCSLIAPGAYIIAADAGWQTAQALGLAPHLVVGDFDSAPPPAGQAAFSHMPEVLRLPTHKDDTDTLFAAREALRRGYRDITLLGVTGGRPDHTQAALATLLFLAKQGAKALLADAGSDVRCVGPGQVLRLPRCAGRYLSVFPAWGEARGVCESGVEYPLENATLTADYPLGVSNEFAADEAVVSSGEGWLFVYTVDKA